MGRGASGHQSSRGDLGHCLAGCRYPSTTCGCLPASAPIPPQLKQIACMQSTTTHLGQVVAEQLRHLERHGRLHAAQHGRLERLCRVVKMSTKRRLEGVLFAGQQAVGMATRALVGAGHPAFIRSSSACRPHPAQRSAPSEGKRSGATFSSPGFMSIMMATMPAIKKRMDWTAVSIMNQRPTGWPQCVQGKRK